VDTVGWRSVFAFALLLGGAITLGAFLSIHETRPQSEAAVATPRILASYLALFRSPRFTAFVLQSGFSSGAFMTAASASASLMPEFLHRPATEFGLYFLAFPLGYFSGNLVSSRVGNRLSIETMVIAGSVVTMVAAMAQYGWLQWGTATPLALFVPGFFLTMGQGISLPYGQVGSMATIPRLAGTAAGIGVFMQFFFGAVFSQFYGLVADSTPWPMTAIVTVTSFLGLAAGAVPMILLKRSEQT
jgi:DHA1 family bicyclomycin/chloramphenicol resistance-like MFS transporter